LFCSKSFSQEVLINDASNNTQNKIVSHSHFNIISKAKAGYKKPLKLPFFDDFIQHKNYPFSLPDFTPSDSLWINSGAMVNNSYPINPPSYGCATLDGLADSGKVYSYVPFAFGGADTLTSRNINLKGIIAADSVYISFFYQPEGHGDYPDIGDSLVLEIKNKNNNWQQLWGVDGFNADPLPTKFTYVILPIIDPVFFDTIFQFRFRNIATFSGNNDHWNIDFIKLDTNRSFLDVANDIAITNIPPRPLINYFEMPFNQFKVNKSAEMNTEIKSEIINNWSVARNVNYGCFVLDAISNDTIKNYSSSSNNVNSLSFITPTPTYTPIYIIPDTLTKVGCSNRYVKEKFYFNPGVGENNNNDTLNYIQKFSNYFAYDDGTAEKVYGLLGNDAKFAYEFNLNIQDTLKAIQIHFAHMNADVSAKLFDLLVWSSIDIPNGVSDIQVQKETFLKPIYVDSLNGWATYPLDTVQVLKAGKFYIGMKQLQTDYLNMGFDMNNDAHTKLYYNTGLGWFQSIITGSLMVRPLFGSCIPKGTFIDDITTQQTHNYQLYPNPTSSQITFETNEIMIDEIKVFDILGQEQLSQSNFIHSSKSILNIEKLNAGIYFLKAINFENGKIITTKFIKH
jgi:hypothetical protein